SNVKSNIWLCSLAIPQMAKRGSGSVVIISSIGGLRGSTVIGAYGISKAADFALCRSLAGEWGPQGVRVNCVAPGLVKTDFARAPLGDIDVFAAIRLLLPTTFARGKRHVLCPRHRPGHHLVPRDRVSRRYFHRRARAAGIPAAFSGLGLGRARAGGYLDLDG